jgi:uncharacterized protein (DUF433 family)
VVAKSALVEGCGRYNSGGNARLDQEVIMQATIVNDRIAGTRITVHDVFYYLENGRSQQETATILRLSPEQVEAAVRYIKEHHEEVAAVYQRIEARNARGNPPEIEARREASRAKMRAWMEERRRAKDEEKNGEGNPGRR